ncbi:DUF3638 domain-containing protein [Legionella worsleiensis]|uniref:Ninein n=1 Tax=Legionella worsleiensis TaxID=45076 RepID=A0A0W1AL85_9GAMM|nr:DUF3638 domain-containing protein [Legionella worsleiensis]KTD81939.1 ninein [Legionella worsleiensis]STY31292.1 ninein [Legionella worsleiensis]
MTIDASLFAHIENDSSLTGTFGLQGNQLANTIKYLSQYLDHLNATQQPFPTDYLILMDQMKNICRLEQMTENMTQATRYNEDIKELAESIADSILTMPKDSKILLPGGWYNRQGGHAMIYEFSPHECGFVFSAINAGAGLQYHAKKSATEKELYSPKKSWLIPTPTSTLLKEELKHFIIKLIKARLPRGTNTQVKAVDDEVLYKEIFPSISYINGEEIDAREGLSEHAYTGGQLSGTCSQRSLHQMLKLNTQSSRDYQRFMFHFKQYALFDYAKACMEKKQSYTPAVLQQIRLAIDNNLKILNSPDLFSPIEIEEEVYKITALEQQLQTIEFDKIQPPPPLKTDTFSYSVKPGPLKEPKVGLNKKSETEIVPPMIKLNDGTNLLKTLLSAVTLINNLSDWATQYVYMEQLILEMPLEIRVTDNSGFYRELSTEADFEQFEMILRQMQNISLGLYEKWIKKEPNPSFKIVLLSITNLQIELHNVITTKKRLPSFLNFSKTVMCSILDNQYRNPFYATNHPRLDQRFINLQKKYNAVPRLNYSDYFDYLRKLLDTEPLLKAELDTLYDAKFGQVTLPMHLKIRENRLKSLFLISLHKDKTSSLDDKFAPIINTVLNHINHECLLRRAINPFFKIQYAEFIFFNFSFDNNHLDFFAPLFVTHVPHSELINNYNQFKYSLKDSPAKVALEADVPSSTSYMRKITPKKANTIQLRPAKPQPLLQEFRQISQEEIKARDYLHLRSDPKLQIALTLDFFTSHIDTLADESNQRYLEANLFQPGLLFAASKNPQFLTQFNAHLKSGVSFFSHNGQHTRHSLLFLRLNYLVSRYLALANNPAGIPRLRAIQQEIEEHLSQSNEAEIVYVLHQYLFLTLLTCMELGEQSNTMFNRAYQAYYYLNSNTNPLILEDKAHTMSMECAHAQFKLFIWQQPQKQVEELIKNILNTASNISETHTVISSQFPVIALEDPLTQSSSSFDAIQGKLFVDGLAQSGVPLFIQNHPLIKELGLAHIKQCLMSSAQDYMILMDKDQEVHLYSSENHLTVRRQWNIQQSSAEYELLALSDTHQAALANPGIVPLFKDLPTILTDGSMNYWHNLTTGENRGILVRDNIPVYSVDNNRIMALDADANETGAYLIADIPTALKQFENHQFLLSHASPSGSFINLPRYNLCFELHGDTLVNKETGERIDEKSVPVHPSVAGLVLVSHDEHQRYLVPVCRFYATSLEARESEFYPLIHDIESQIPRTIIYEELHSKPLERPPLWRHRNSQKCMSFRLKNGEPVADKISDALYLAYLYMATDQTRKAWQTLEECTTRFGGLTGNAEELQYIYWICKEIPHVFFSIYEDEFDRNKPKRNTPTYVACQLKAMSLLCDFLIQNGSFDLKDIPEPYMTANALYESIERKKINMFQKALPEHIYLTFSRLQTMRRHLEHTYVLSPLERKKLLTYYYQSQPQGHAPSGALGYEWMSLSLEELLRERNALLARQTANQSLVPFDAVRLNFISENLTRLQPVVAKSTQLNLVPISLDIPKNYRFNETILKPQTIIQMNQWLNKLPGVLLSPQGKKDAVTALSSTITEDDFVLNFPAYLQIACDKTSEEHKKLYDYCSKTLIAKRHIKLEDQDSNIPLMCNLLYRLLTTASGYVFKYQTYTFSELISVLEHVRIPPLSVYEAKDVYFDYLAQPEELIAHYQPSAYHPLKISQTASVSLLEEMGIEYLLAQNSADLKALLDQLITQYTAQENQTHDAIALLAKDLDSDLEQVFNLEEQAGIILYNQEQKKREIAQTLIESSPLINALLNAAEIAEPILKQKIAQSWSKAIELANQGPDDLAKQRTWTLERKSRARGALTQSDLLSLYSRADAAYSIAQTGLSLTDAKKLHDLTHHALVQGISLQALVKIKTDLTHSLTTNNPIIAAQALDLLARDHIPGLKDPSIVILQHEDNIVLRKRQLSALESLLHEPEDGSRFNETIEKIIMGGGKSKVIIPILAEKKAQGDNLVVIEVPQALLATNHVDLNKTSQRLFGKRAYRFEFTRESDCTPKRLEQIYQMFTEVITTQSYLVTCGESIQSLELKYVDLLLSTTEQNETWKKQVFWLDKINTLFRNHADCLIDEVHQGLSIKKKLNYTSGESKSPELLLIKNAIALFGFIDSALIAEAPSYDKSYDWKPFMMNLANKLIRDPASPLHSFLTQAQLKYGAAVQDELINYLTNKTSAVPEAVLTADKDTQNSLAFFKQQLKVTLSRTLSQKLGKHYGESQLKKCSPLEKTLAIPYSGVDTPNERNRYKDQLEAINKTIQMMLLKGLGKEQLIVQLNSWISQARQELLQHQLSQNVMTMSTLDDTSTAQGFALITAGCDLTLHQINVKNETQMMQVHQKLQWNRALMFDFLRQYALKQVTQDGAILPNDNFNHTDQYRSIQGVSGTPSLNGAAYHQRLKYNKGSSLGSDGYILEVLKNKTTLSSCDYTGYSQFIKDIISLSPDRSRVRSIIDIRGTFTGVSNRAIAKEIALYIRAYPDHFSSPLKQVLYFNEDQILCALSIHSPQKITVLGTTEHEEINRLLESIPEQRITLYDQIHTTGTDIKQYSQAHALVLVDDKTTSHELLQGVMRQRELDQEQTNEWIIPKRMSTLSVEQLYTQFKHNEKAMVGMEAPAAAQEQMRNHIRRKFLTLIQDIPSEQADKKAALIQHFRPFFEEIQMQDLFTLYGGINRKKAIELLLKHYQKQIKNLWKSQLESAEMPPLAQDIENMSQELMLIINKAIPFCLPEYDTIDTSFNTEVEVQKEVQSEVQIELMTLNESYRAHLSEQLEVGWAAFISPENLFLNQTQLQTMTQRLNALCKKQDIESQIFSENLLVSKNYESTYSSQKEGINAFLKPVYLVWYYLNNENKISAVIITPQEADDVIHSVIKNHPRSWISTTRDTLVAGSRPDHILESIQYIKIREQIRFFSGEFYNLLNQDSPLLWLHDQTDEKISFFENNLLRYRPGCEESFHHLKEALSQTHQGEYTYIANHPYEDLTQFNWADLIPQITPSQKAEHIKLAEVFVYINQNWHKKIITIGQLQSQFILPMNTLIYVNQHLSFLMNLRDVIIGLNGNEQIVNFMAFIESLKPSQKKALEECIGMSIAHFYELHQCEPYNPEELMSEERSAKINATGMALINLLDSTPAFKGKMLFHHFFEHFFIYAETVDRTRREFRINTAELRRFYIPTVELIRPLAHSFLPTKSLLDLMIKYNRFEEVLLLDILDNRNDLSSAMLIKIISRTNSEKVLLKILTKDNLDEEIYSEILTKNTTNPMIIEALFTSPSATAQVKERLLNHELINPEVALNLLSHHSLTKNELKLIINNPSVCNEHVIDLLISQPHIETPELLLLLGKQMPVNLVLKIALKMWGHNKDHDFEGMCLMALVEYAQRHNAVIPLTELVKEHNSAIPVGLIIKLLTHLDKNILAQTDFCHLISKANKEELDELITLDKEYSQEELMLLAQMNLDTLQIDRLLDHRQMNHTVAAFLFKKAEFSGRIKAWSWLTKDLLESTLDNTRDYDSLALALNLGALPSETAKQEWLEKKRQDQQKSSKVCLKSNNLEAKFNCILEELKLKSLAHALKATNDPLYATPAQVSFELYQKLHAEVKTLLANPSENTPQFKKNCQEALNAAKPVLNTHRGYKQILLDIANILFAVAALFRKGGWRLFEAQTHSMSTVNKVLEDMNQLIEENTTQAASSSSNSKRT